MAGYNNYNGNGGYQQNNQQNGGNRNYNLVQNWNLRVFRSRVTKKGMMLNCAFNGRKRPDGTYPKAMNVSVFVGNDTQCEFAPNTPLENQSISVSGSFSVDDWTNQQGVTSNNFTIFATRISIRQRNNNYQQNNGYQQSGGYQQNGGYQNNNYQQNSGYNNQQGGYQQGNFNQQNGGYQQSGGFGGGPQNGGYNNQQNGGYQQGNFNQQNGGIPNDFPDFESFASDDNGVPF